MTFYTDQSLDKTVKVRFEKPFLGFYVIFPLPYCGIRDESEIGSHEQFILAFQRLVYENFSIIFHQYQPRFACLLLIFY